MGGNVIDFEILKTVIVIIIQNPFILFMLGAPYHDLGRDVKVHEKQRFAIMKFMNTYTATFQSGLLTIKKMQMNLNVLFMYLVFLLMLSHKQKSNPLIG